MNSYQLSRDKVDKENEIIQISYTIRDTMHPLSNQYQTANNMNVEWKKHTGLSSHTLARRPGPS